MRKDLKEKQDEVISRITGVLNAANIYHDRHRLAEERIKELNQLKESLQTSLKRLQRNFKSLHHDSVTPAGKALLNAIEEDLKETTKEEKQFSLLMKQGSPKGGRKKTPDDVCIVILEGIDFCERNKLSPDWLNKLLSPVGDIQRTQKKIIQYPLSSLPVIPVMPNDSQWLTRLKETLQRSLFSGKEKVQKKKSSAFREKEEVFYEIIRSKEWGDHWLQAKANMVDRFLLIDKKFKK